MKKIILLVFFTALTISSFAEYVYVSAPVYVNVTPRPFFDKSDTIYVAVSDSRVLPPESKIECSSDVIKFHIVNLIKKTYPEAIVKILPNNNLSEKGQINAATIYIDIVAYQSVFAKDIITDVVTIKGKRRNWLALTAMKVKIIDYRKGVDKENQKDIFADRFAFNFRGWSTASDALDETFSDCMIQLFQFIDNSLMGYFD